MSHPMDEQAEDRRTSAQRRADKAADRAAVKAANKGTNKTTPKAARYRRMAARKADSMPVVEALDGPRVERVVDAPLVPPAPKGGLREVFRHYYLLRLIVMRELAQMYSASVLGLLWSYVQPAIRFGMYFFVMGIVLDAHRSVPFFAIHLFCGMAFVHYFTETFHGGTRSISQNRNLVKKMAMPREIFPVASSVVALYHAFPQMVLLTVICVFVGWNLSWGSVVALLLGFAIITTFGTGLALLFSAANVFFRDFQNIVTTITSFVHFMVPMMYSWHQVERTLSHHPVWTQLYLGDPIAVATLLVQRCFWYGVVQGKQLAGTPAHQAAELQSLQFPPHLLWRGAITLVVCTIFMMLCQRAFSRLESKFPERL